MGRRLALLAEASHTSPWTRASGCESFVRVKGLGGSRVGMQVELQAGGELLLFCAEGLTDLQPFSPNEWSRYRVVKQASEPIDLTTVEVILGHND